MNSILRRMSVILEDNKPILPRMSVIREKMDSCNRRCRFGCCGGNGNDGNARTQMAKNPPRKKNSPRKTFAESSNV